MSIFVERAQHSFTPVPTREMDECGTGRKKEHICIRILRKKYKCILIFILLFLVLLEASVLILKHVEDIDKQFIKHIVETIMDSIYNTTDIIHNVTIQHYEHEFRTATEVSEVDQNRSSNFQP